MSSFDLAKAAFASSRVFRIRSVNSLTDSTLDSGVTAQILPQVVVLSSSLLCWGKP
jgi:hypothetical protein